MIGQPKNTRRDAEIVLIRLLDKVSYAEIGRRFGISGNRVRQIVYRHAQTIRKAAAYGPGLTNRARHSVALTWTWDQLVLNDEARKVWPELYKKRDKLYVPTPAEIEERRLYPIHFLRTPHCGRRTLQEIVMWMQRAGHWGQFDSMGRSIG